MNFLYLFTNFFRIGLFAIGGGLATVPFLFEIADSSDWLTREAIANMLAVAQSLPGAIGVNLAAYVGFIHSGPAGGFAAALGLVAPSIIIIIIIARILDRFKESKIIKSLFTAFRPAAAGLLSAAGFSAIMLSIWNAAAPVWYEFLRWKELILMGVLFFLIYKFKKHPLLYIAGAGVIGIILGL
ncbi:MAG: chromate transporter [Treponema sp.]|nr:chromate transporter [Treponema sp.]